MGIDTSKPSQVQDINRNSNLQIKTHKSETIQKMIQRVQGQIEKGELNQPTQYQNQASMQGRQQIQQQSQQVQSQYYQTPQGQMQQQQQQRYQQNMQYQQGNYQQVNGRIIQMNGQNQQPQYGYQNYQQLKIKVNCNINEYLFLKLPSSVLYLILSFLMNDYISIIMVSPLWYYKLHECIETELLKIDNDFIKSYSNSLLFKNSYLTIKPIKVNNHYGFRMDRNICAEVLPSISNKTVSIKYTYKSFRRVDEYKSQQKQKRYLCEFHIDAVQKKSSRTIWAYKDDCNHNYDKKKVAFIQPITPVKIGDNIKISVNFFNMNGLVNIYSIQWKDLTTGSIPNVPIYIDPNKIDNYEKERICETEEIYSDWVLYEYFHKINKKKIDDFSPYLYLKEVYCAGVDIITSKHIFIAKQPSNGILQKSKEKLGVYLQILDDKEDQICEIKRKGLYQDNETTIQLRVGDIFVFYISSGD
ncbi:hypothetical protein ABPG74_022090 [Tetrahymena malaccensis]